MIVWRGLGCETAEAPPYNYAHKGFKCNVLRMKRSGCGKACLIGTGLAPPERTHYWKKATLKSQISVFSLSKSKQVWQIDFPLILTGNKSLVLPQKMQRLTGNF